MSLTGCGALDAGADDYLAKPFSFGELCAAAGADPARAPERPAVLAAGDFRLDPAGRRAWRGHTELVLSSREFSLLEFLLRHAGQVVTRTMILEHVWDMAYDPASNVVDQYVAYLRRKVDRPFGVEQPETVRGAGYRLLEAGSRPGRLGGHVAAAAPGAVVRRRHRRGDRGRRRGVLVAAAGRPDQRHGCGPAGPRARADAVAAEVRAGGLPALPAQGGEQGQNQGEFPVAEAESQVLTPQGAARYSSAGSGQLPLVTGEWLRRAAAGTVTFLARSRARACGCWPSWSGTAPGGDRRGRGEHRGGRRRPVPGAGGHRGRRAAAVAVAGLGAWVLAGAALRPVTRMRRRLAEITEHNPAARLVVPAGRDEIAALAVTMNALLDRLQLALDRQRDFVPTPATNCSRR